MVPSVSENEDLLSIDVTADGESALMVVSGELDPHTGTAFEAAVAPLRDDPQLHRLTFDLSGVSFIDSSGLGVILLAHQVLTGRDGSVVVRTPSPAVRRLLEITDLLGLLEGDESDG